MARAPWFLDPEVLMFGQVAGVAAFLVALIFTVVATHARNRESSGRSSMMR